MSTQIKGSKFIYEIDEKDFPHGFIAQGTESFVFKGRKISVNGQDEEELSFSCVLKFKPYSRSRFERFTNNELRIFEELQECRSVARIYDVIEDLASVLLKNISTVGLWNNTVSGSFGDLRSLKIIVGLNTMSLRTLKRKKF